MEIVLHILDKTGRKIHLSKKQWTHIRKKHPEVEDIETIKQTIEKYDKITNYGFDSSVHYYYKFFKHKQPPNQYLCIAIKYLNGEAYIITEYYTKNIK